MLDMEASPYDLRAFGYEPVRVETTEGRREYQRRQRELSERAAKLRCELVDIVRDVLAAGSSSAPSPDRHPRSPA